MLLRLLLACLASASLGMAERYLMVYPQSPVLEIGTNFTATCVISNTQEVTSEDLFWNLSKTTIPREQYTKINSTALSVTITVQGEEYEWLYCIAKKKSDFVFSNKGKLTHGIRLEKGYRPEKPDSLSCEAHQEESKISDLITCKWNSVGKQTKGVRTNYSLIVDVIGFRKYIQSTEQNFAQLPVSLFPHHMSLDIWVEAHNELGGVTSEHLKDDSNCFAKTNPPRDVNVISEDIIPFSLLLSWTPPISKLYVELCYQIRYCEKGSHVWNYVPQEDTAADNQSFRLQNLHPDTEYIIQVRSKYIRKCHRCIYSDWSTNTTKLTPQAKPEGKPELWRIITEADSSGKQTVQIICKDPVASNGMITSFNLRVQSLEEKLKNTSLNWEYFPVNRSEAARVPHKRKITPLKKLYLADGKFVTLHLTASNSVGESAEALLTLPDQNRENENVDGLNVSSTGGQLCLNWTRPKRRGWSGYIVEWLNGDQLDWQRENKNTTHTAIKGPLEPFVCYNISVYPIYGLRIGRPVMVQAYLEQGVPLEGPVVDLKEPGHNTAELVWTEIPPNKRRGFITNYTIIYSNGTDIHTKTVPGNVTSYTLKSLRGNTKYGVRIAASTALGSTDGLNHYFTTLKYAAGEIESIVVAVSLGFLFFVLLTMVLCFYKRKDITKNFWPRIPDPGKSTIRNWTPEYPLKSETPRESCLSGFSVVDVEVCDVKSVLEEDKSSLALKKDKYMSEEHSSGIGGSSCMSSPRQSVSDSDEGGDMVDTTASTVQYSSVVASNGYKGQTPSSQAQQVMFSRSESTQPLLDCEDNSDVLSQDGSRQSQHFIQPPCFTGNQDESNLDLLVPQELLEPLDFCPLQEDPELTSAGGDLSAAVSGYMPQKAGYKQQL